MSDWPETIADFSPYGIISTADSDSPVGDMALNCAVLFSSAALWPSANLAIYMPVVVRRQITVYQLGWINGSAVAGNADVGIYDKSLARLVSAGSTAVSGTSAVQLVDITDTTLAAGVYYLAMSSDTSGATQLFNRGSFTAAASLRACGCAQQASAFPLPSSATFATMAQSYAPLLYGAIESSTI